MAYNWRETLPQYASISGVLAGFSITFIIFVLREDQSSQQLAYGVSWGVLSALLMGISAVLFIQASQYFLTAKDHDIYGMPREKFDALSEQAKTDAEAKSLRDATLGGNLFNFGRLALFVGVTLAVWPFSPAVAVVVGLGGVSLELYQIVVYLSERTQRTKPQQAASKSRRRSRKTYLKLTISAVILIGLNYVFTKLFDATFGKFDVWYVLGIWVVGFGFIGFFTIFLWWADDRGTLARMMGATDEDQ